MVRFKNRYFIVELDVKGRPSHAPLVIANKQVKNVIFHKVQEIHGDFGVAAITNGLRIKYCNPYTKILMIKVMHGPHKLVGTVLPLVKEIDNIKVQMNILHVGSTMMKCYKFIRNHQLASLEKYWNKMKTENDKIRMKEAILAVDLKPES